MEASWRAHSLPKPTLAPVINTFFMLYLFACTFMQLFKLWAKVSNEKEIVEKQKVPLISVFSRSLLKTNSLTSMGSHFVSQR
jgi:hypothetical protein